MGRKQGLGVEAVSMEEPPGAGTMQSDFNAGHEAASLPFLGNPDIAHP